MGHNPAGVPGLPAAKKLTIRIDPELHRALRVRCALLDAPVQDFVAAYIEMALKAEVDPRSR